MESNPSYRFLTSMGAVVLVLFILLGGYFYIKKSASDNELKLNTATEEATQLREQNQILTNREKASLEEMSKLQQELEKLKTEVAGTKQLNQKLEQEKTVLMGQIELLKAHTDGASTPAPALPVVPIQAPPVNTTVLPADPEMPQITPAPEQKVIPETKPILKPEVQSEVLPEPHSQFEPTNLTPLSDTKPQVKIEAPKTVAATASDMFCPTSDEVNRNLTSGTWEKNKMTWWVDFSSRPLDDGEKVLDFMKAISEDNASQVVSCYYQIGATVKGESTEAWLTVKTSAPKGKAIKTSGASWGNCSREGENCQARCTAKDVTMCAFEISTP